MKALIKFPMASFLMLPFDATLFAQGALIGSEALDDRIYDTPTDVGKGFARAEDALRFGNNQHLFQVVNSGWSRS